MTAQSKSRTYVLIALVTMGVAAGGIAFAIPDSAGIINGCYDKVSGKLRVIQDASQGCANNETALSWSVTGPSGPQGIPGPQGQPGPTGPSHAYSTRSNTRVPLTGDIDPVLSLTVPAGTYVIDAKSIIEIATTSRVGIECDLQYSPQNILFGDVSVFLVGQDAETTIPLHDARTFDVQTTISLACGKGPAGSARAGFSAIVATKVGALN